MVLLMSRPLFVGYVVGSQPMKGKKKMQVIINANNARLIYSNANLVKSDRTSMVGVWRSIDGQ